MGTVHLVATPIGNLEDITLRALRVLREADRIYAEDTRRTRILLSHHDIPGRPRSLHAHNEAARIPEILEALAAGEAVALVSDAGTPLISDPGERLVNAAARAGHEIVPVPGASAVLAALSASGLESAPFTFLGFLPRKPGARRALLERHAEFPGTLVLFESPRRLAKTLDELHLVLGNRRACVARELTKMHEELVRGSLEDLRRQFAEGARGEVTLVIEGALPGDALDASNPAEDLDTRIQERLDRGERPRELAAQLSATLVLSKRTIYNRAVQLQKKS